MKNYFNIAALILIPIFHGCGTEYQTKSGPKQTIQRTADCGPVNPTYANLVVQATGASGVLFGDPTRATNGVRGLGQNSGSTDVFSLDKTQDGAIILSWSNRRVCNGPGADFNVFENAFSDRRSGSMFFEAIIVSVSLDGINYQDFPHEYSGTNSPTDLARAGNWRGFAGLHAVIYNEDTHNFPRDGIDPLDSLEAGGDLFDLEDLPESDVGVEIKAHGFRFLKLLAAPKGGFLNVPSAMGGYADIDGVYASRFFNN